MHKLTIHAVIDKTIVSLNFKKMVRIENSQLFSGTNTQRTQMNRERTYGKAAELGAFNEIPGAK